MKKREIFIVIALIAFGVLYNAYKTGDIEIGFYEGCSVDSSGLLDSAHLNNYVREEIRYPAGDIREIEIDNPAGSISVEKAPEGAEKNIIRILPEIHVFHRDKDEAAGIYKEIRIRTRVIDSDDAEENEPVEANPNPKKLLISLAPGETFPYRRVRVQFKLIIPPGIELDIRNRFGNIEIRDCGKNVFLNGKHGDIRVRNIDSPLKIRHRHGNVAVSDIRDAVAISSSYSKIKIKNVAQLKLDCSHARVFIGNVEKDTGIEYAAYSFITMEKGREFTADARHTKIKLEDITGGIRIKNSHENIYMKNVKGNVQVKARHCKIELADSDCDDVSIDNSYDSVRLEGLSAGNVNIRLDNGKLDIDFDRIGEQINIRNAHSRISLEYPPSLQPLFSIHVLHGNIINRTPIEMTILEERGEVTLNAGSMESKPRITIDNTYGDVLLKTLSPETETGPKTGPEKEPKKEPGKEK